MGFWQNLFGDLLGNIVGAGASAYSTWQSGRNTDKSLQAQRVENEKNRLYNLQLAQKQNQWNIQQWQRENAALRQATAEERAYNSPAAQKARLEAAGLNADMMYGQGGISNTSSAAGVASSPQMTAGSPSSPMDWSALANKPTVGDAIMKSLAIRQAEANIEKTESETTGNVIDNEFKPLEKTLGLELTKSEIDKNRGLLKQLLADTKRLQQQTLNLKQEQVNAALDYTIKSKSMQYQLRSLAAQAKVDEADAEVALKSVVYRTAVQQYAADEAKYKAEAAEHNAAIAKFQKNAQWYHEFLQLWDHGIRTFETYLDFRGWVTDVDTWLDDDGKHKRTHRHPAER